MVCQTAWLLRDCSSLLCQPLAAIFNSSIREGFVHPICKSAEVLVVPIDQPSNFNPKGSPSNFSSPGRYQSTRRHTDNTSPVESTPFFIPSTSLCSLSSWFTSSCAYHLITVITFVRTICHSLDLSLQT